MNTESPTIAAIATPQGSGGIGIIRMSGKMAANILSTLFRPKGKTAEKAESINPENFISHRMYFGNVVDSRDNRFIDEVLVVLMRGPRSYTTEDVVEIQSHAGYVVLKKILELVIAQGACLAAPGEFTRRAFLNGRIDLTQAEAIADIIEAKTETSLAIAGGLLTGELGNEIGLVRNRLLTLLAEIEADIDFPEEIDDPLDRERIPGDLEKDILGPLDRLIQAYERRHFFRDGLKMAIVGRPNVGKSSLLNRLILRDRAIVTEIPGTTRDSIEEMIDIDGLPVVIVDTAGLHETSQTVERLGIERTYAAIEEADIILFVVDLSQGITAGDREIYRHIGKKEHILVLNKVDLRADTDLPESWNDAKAIKVSALEGVNLDSLKSAIYDIGVGTSGKGNEASLVPNLRQAENIKGARGFVNGARDMLSTGLETDLVAIDLRAAVERLDEILGLSCQEDVLDIIFSRFCVGK